MTDLGVRIDALRDEASSARVDLPPDVESAYGGPLRLPEEVVYANFVSSIDGVAAIEGTNTSSALISGGEPADRFVMALLRSVADAVVVGSGTFREHEGPWTAAHAYPPGAERFPGADLPGPRLVVTTASGQLPVDHPAIGGSLIATTTRGARAIAERFERPLDALDLGEEDRVDPHALVRALRERGYRRILTEGGPGWMGSMLAASALDELFLTLSPKLLGGAEGHVPLSGNEDLRDVGHDMRLLGVRVSAEHLFLRYGVLASDVRADRT